MLSMTFSGGRGSALLAVLAVLGCVFFTPVSAYTVDGIAPVALTPYVQEPMKVVQEKAEDGDGAAELELGLRYVRGYDGIRDVPLGVEWIRKAADRGIPQAEHELGALYLMGVGVPQSNETAALWFGRAAIQGYAPSQTALGFAYEEGAGVPQNAQRARYWFDKAAAQHGAVAEESLQGSM